MSYIFINTVDIEDSFKIVDRAINECKVVKELNIGKNMLNEIININNMKVNFIKKIYYEFKIKNYEKKLRTNLNTLKDDSKVQFILSKDILNNETIKIYISDFLINLGFIEYIYNGEYKENITRYIKIYTTNKNIENTSAKCVVIYNKIDMLDTMLLSKLLSEHKRVDIYSEIEPSKYINRKLNEFNKLEGTTVTILKGTKKALREYNVAIFVDKNKEHYKKIRLDKETLVLDLTKLDEDILDTNYVTVYGMLKNNKLIETIVKRLYSNYGNNIVASIITKIT